MKEYADVYQVYQQNFQGFLTHATIRYHRVIPLDNSWSTCMTNFVSAVKYSEECTDVCIFWGNQNSNEKPQSREIETGHIPDHERWVERREWGVMLSFTNQFETEAEADEIICRPHTLLSSPPPPPFTKRLNNLIPNKQRNQSWPAGASNAIVTSECNIVECDYTQTDCGWQAETFSLLHLKKNNGLDSPRERCNFWLGCVSDLGHK